MVVLKLRAAKPENQLEAANRLLPAKLVNKQERRRRVVKERGKMMVKQRMISLRYPKWRTMRL